jgi:hypothetical protein
VAWRADDGERRRHPVPTRRRASGHASRAAPWWRRWTSHSPAVVRAAASGAASSSPAAPPGVVAGVPQRPRRRGRRCLAGYVLETGACGDEPCRRDVGIGHVVVGGSRTGASLAQRLDRRAALEQPFAVSAPLDATAVDEVPSVAACRTGRRRWCGATRTRAAAEPRWSTSCCVRCAAAATATSTRGRR